MEELECPECGHHLEEEELRKKLVCPNCKTKLHNSKYKDFLELLIYLEVVDDIDFFDMNLYGMEILNEEREDYDEPELDISKFEKHKEVWDEFEDDTELKQRLETDDEREEAWDIFNDARAIDEDWDDMKNEKE